MTVNVCLEKSPGALFASARYKGTRQVVKVRLSSRGQSDRENASK